MSETGEPIINERGKIIQQSNATPETRKSPVTPMFKIGQAAKTTLNEEIIAGATGRPIPQNPVTHISTVTQAVDKAAKEGWTPITEKPLPPSSPAKGIR